MSGSAGLTAWQFAFQKSPVILTNGIANLMPNGMLPILAITEALNLPLGLLTGGDINLDRTFANFAPLGGSSILAQDVGRYPFANQAVAANATIQQPLSVSLQMITVAQEEFGYWQKLATMTALQLTLQEHNKRGGTYIVVTPSIIYTNCILLSIRDVSADLTKQPQNAWQLDFEKPLLTLDDAEAAQNSLMSLLTSATTFVGQPALSGLTNTIGQAISVVSAAILPIQSGAIGAGQITVSALPPL